MWTVFIRDNSSRKRAEAQIATLAHAVESTAEPICITDLEDRFTFVNCAFQKTYGYTEAEILGKTPEILFSPNNTTTGFGTLPGVVIAGGGSQFTYQILNPALGLLAPTVGNPVGQTSIQGAVTA